MIKSRIWTLVLVLMFMSSAGYSQSNEYRCKLITADLNKDDASTIGEFTVSSTKPGHVRKAFRLPTTDLYINSAVLLKGEHGAKNESRPTLMYLILAIGKKEYSRVETEMKNDDVRSNAMTRSNLTGTRKVEVSTTFLGRPEPVILTLECRN
jgi:hypothetical protein